MWLWIGIIGDGCGEVSRGIGGLAGGGGGGVCGGRGLAGSGLGSRRSFLCSLVGWRFGVVFIGGNTEVCLQFNSLPVAILQSYTPNNH